jgi:hypothetical protein
LEDFEKELNKDVNQGGINNLKLDPNQTTVNYIFLRNKSTDPNNKSIDLLTMTSATDTVYLATVNITKNQNNQANINIQGNPEVYTNPQTNAYSYNTSLADIMLANYLFNTMYHPYYSPYHWGYYPGWYHPYYPMSYYGYGAYSRGYCGRSVHYTKITYVTNNNVRHRSYRTPDRIKNTYRPSAASSGYRPSTTSKPSSGSTYRPSTTSKPSSGSTYRPSAPSNSRSSSGYRPSSSPSRSSSYRPSSSGGRRR